MPRWAWLLLALLPALFLFLPAREFDYVWDDLAFFVSSPSLRQGALWPAVTEPVLIGTSYFRPLVMLWYAAELRLLDHPIPWAHLTNLVLHLANGFLIGLLCLRLAGEDRSRTAILRAVAAVALYTLHPALIEPVAWISGRFDLAVTFFCLLGLLLFTARHPWAVVASALAFFAATFCKEMAATFPALAFLYLWALRAPEASLKDALKLLLERPRLKACIAIGVVGAVYLAVRFHYMGVVQQQDHVLGTYLASIWSRLGFIGYSIELYVRLAVWPFQNLGPLHPIDLDALNNAERIHGCAVVLAALLAVGFALARPSRARLLLAAGLLALVPVINIVPLMIVGNIGHERFLTLPLALAVLGLLHVSTRGWPLSAPMRASFPKLAGGALVLWCGVAVLNLQVTLPLWRNELTLWRWAYEQHPDLQYAQFSLASAALRMNNYKIADEVLKKAESAGPIPLRLSVPYGQYLIRTGHAADGVAKIEAALQKEFQPHLQMLADGGDLDKDTVSKKESAGWLMIYAYTVLAEGHITLRQFDRARQDARVALYYQRDNPTSLLLRSFASYGLDQWGLAQREFDEALSKYWANGQVSARELRGKVLKQLCERPAEAPETCRHAAAESAAAPTQ